MRESAPLGQCLGEVWRVRSGRTAGNPLRDRTAVIVVIARTRSWRRIAQPRSTDHDYHLIIAS